MNITILSASPLSNSNSMRFCRMLEKKLALKGHHVEIIDFEKFDIPFMNKGEVDPENLNAFQKELIDSVTMPDWFLFVHPNIIGCQVPN